MVHLLIALLVLLLLYAMFKNRLEVWWVCRKADRALEKRSNRDTESLLTDAYTKIRTLSADVEYLRVLWKDLVQTTCGAGRSDLPRDPFSAELFISHADMEKHLLRMQAEEREVRAKAQKEYAGGENSFGNFVRLGKMLGLPPQKILWVYAVKHFDGILAHVNGHKSQRESVRGRIKDARIYLALLDAMETILEQSSSSTVPCGEAHERAPSPTV